MAVIDLKQTILTIRDGSVGVTQGISDAGATGSSYDTGDTAMSITGLTGIVFSGQTFVVTGETGSPVHTVVGHSETAGNTTSVSFTPGLASDVVFAVVVTFTALATETNQIEVKIGEGTLSYTEKRNMEYRRDRGRLNTVREGDEEPVEVSFDFEWEFLRSSTGEEVTVEEALKNTGAAAEWISTSADLCEPYCIDIVVEYIPPCSDADSEIIVLQDFRWETLDHNLKDGQISAKGNCNVVEAVVTREAQAMPMGMARGRSNRPMSSRPTAGAERANQVQKQNVQKRQSAESAKQSQQSQQPQQAKEPKRELAASKR